ncbi:MAG: mandelate racemase/muconate lactonizing enzyme family protein [Bryobacterales bacterium]|nr:mandelate racemase/muconate lactonizing enzyme family protein [Bryobacterales bacterium]
MAGAAAAAGAFLPGCSPEAQREAADKAGVSYPSEGIKRENIKITDVKVTPLSYVDPKKNLWRTGSYIVWKSDAALCRVFTDQGIVGIGEGTPYSGPDNIQKYTEEKIKPALIGQNPFDVDFIACATLQPLPHGGRADTAWNSPSITAWAGVNNALWDIIGKAKNMPVYKLLAADGKGDPHIRIYASGGVEHEWYNKGDQFLIEEALRYKEAGYTAFKFRKGTDWAFSKLTLKSYMPLLRKLREAVGPDMKLMHESLGGVEGLTVEEVVRDFCPLLEELKFHWLEQPLGGLENYVKINEALKTVMLSGGEMNWSRFDIKPWIDSGALDIVQTDTNNTGLSENWHIARMAHLKGKYHCPHNWHGGLTTIANAHLVAAIPNRHMLELNTTYNPLKEEIFKDPLVVKKGYMDLHDKPGYGVELIPDVEKKFPWAPGSFQRPNPVIVKS